MHSSILILASSAAFFSQASAKAVSSPDALLAQVRFYGQESCTTAETMGYFNLYGEDVGKCHTFSTDKAVKSISTSYLEKGCALETFSDKVCSFDRHDVKKTTCLSGDKSYGSYKVICAK